MKKIPIILAILALPALAWAACTHYTVTRSDGTVEYCQKCCSGGSCYVTCF